MSAIKKIGKQKIQIDTDLFEMGVSSHSFNISVACLFKCSDTATIINDLIHWRAVNMSNNTNNYDNNYWTYMTVKAWNEKYPYMMPNKIRGILEKLESMGFIETGNYNPLKYDRTKWYALTEKASKIFNFPFVKITNGNPKLTNGFVNKTNVICYYNEPIPNNFTNNFTNNNQQQQNENFEKIVDVADPDNDTDNDLHNIEPQQAQTTETEYKPFGVKSLNEVLGKIEPKKETPKIEKQIKQIKTSTLSNVYDFNEMKFEDIADLLYSFNGNKLRESVIRLNQTTNENFKDAVCAFLLQTTATEKIEHLTEKDLAKHFSNWCNRVGKEVIDEKAKQYRKSLTDNNCKIDAKDVFKAFQADLLQKIDKGELKREKALQMATNKKIELGIQ